MDLNNIKKLIKENEQEIANLINELGLDKNHIDFSKLVKGNLSDRFTFLDEQTKKLKEYVTFCEQKRDELEKLEATKTDDKKEKKNINEKIASIKRELKNKGKDITKMSQGKVRSVISSFFGQVDKRIHNAIYAKETSISNRLWKNHENRVLKRYNNVSWYLVKNALIMLGIVGIPFVLPLLPASTGVINAFALGAGIFGGNTIIKTISAVYNKIRYGGPLLERKMPILNGSYLDNIKESFYQNRKSNLILSNEIVVSNSSLKPETAVSTATTETATTSKTNTKSTGSHVVDNSKLIIINKIDTFNLGNDKIEDYASLISIVRSKGLESNLPTVVLTGHTLSTKQKYDEIVSKYNALYEALKKKEEPVKKDEPVVIDAPKAVDKPVSSPTKEDVKKLSIDSTMTFSKAISIVRDSKAHSKDELESAMGKLASTFGNRNKKADAGDIKKALSDFNKSEKMLSEYGNKIKKGKANTEDKMIYQALLMHLAKYEKNEPFSIDTLEDDIRDYLDDIADKAEEYDRRKNPTRYDSDGNFVGKGRK